MSVDRVANLTQSSYLASQMMKRETDVSTLSDQVTSGNVSPTYDGYGNKTMAMESARAVVNRTTGYQSATGIALSQAEVQDNQLDQLSSLSQQLTTAISHAVSTNDGSTLSATCSDIFDQAKAILNYQDANGSYIYGGGNDTSPPFTVAKYSDLASLSTNAITDPTDPNYVFSNGSTIKSVQVSDSETVSYGATASAVGTKLMSVLQSVSKYVAAKGSDFTASMDNNDTDFLSSAIGQSTAAYKDINQSTALNGSAYQRIKTASDTQTTTVNLYKGFVSDVQDVDMAQASTNLTNAQTALQASVMITSSLNKISLLNYLS